MEHLDFERAETCRRPNGHAEPRVFQGGHESVEDGQRQPGTRASAVRDGAVFDTRKHRRKTASVRRAPLARSDIAGSERRRAVRRLSTRSRTSPGRDGSVRRCPSSTTAASAPSARPAGGSPRPTAEADGSRRGKSGRFPAVPRALGPHRRRLPGCRWTGGPARLARTQGFDELRPARMCGSRP
jgi:hypothetical protein